MKIAVYHNIPPGGAKRVLFEEIKRLSKNHEIFLFELESTDETFLDIREFCKEVKKYKIKIREHNKFKRLNEDFWIITSLRIAHKKIAKEIDSQFFDIVLVHPDLYSQSPFILRYLKTPSVYYCHEWLRIAYEKEFRLVGKITPLKRLYESVSRRIKKQIDFENVKKAKMILVNSEFTRENVKKAYQRNAEVVYPGVDTQIFKEGNNKKKKQILFMGAKIDANGFLYVKKAMRFLPQDYTLKVLDISDIKFVSDIKLSSFYRESFVFVSMSFNEPFGLAPLESMACGTPVIALNQGGYRETVEDSLTGYLVSKNPFEIANKIISLENKAIYNKLSKNGILNVNRKWTWEKHISKLEKLFTLIAKK